MKWYKSLLVLHMDPVYVVARLLLASVLVGVGVVAIKNINDDGMR